MTVRVRLQRLGRRNRPFYRVVVADSRSPRNGKFIELVGTYNPLATRGGVKEVTFNVERIRYWISVGAQPSDRVAWLLGQFGVLPPKVVPVARTKKAMPRKEWKEMQKQAGKQFHTSAAPLPAESAGDEAIGCAWQTAGAPGGAGAGAAADRKGDVTKLSTALSRLSVDWGGRSSSTRQAIDSFAWQTYPPSTARASVEMAAVREEAGLNLLQQAPRYALTSALASRVSVLGPSALADIISPPP